MEALFSSTPRFERALLMTWDHLADVSNAVSDEIEHSCIVPPPASINFLKFLSSYKSDQVYEYTEEPESPQ
jgi:hypothetical protein